MPEWWNWYTRTTQNRVSKGMGVQVSPPAPNTVDSMPKIIVVLGPTATGKSDLAVELAKLHHGEVVSADSRQVYTGLNLGTGKITKKEMQGVPHHLLDVVSPKKVFTVSDFKTQAEKAIEDILKRGKLPILCGGTGFYIQSIVDSLVLPSVAPDKNLRELLEKKSAEELFVLLQKMDPERARTIDKENPVRLVRALEIASCLGVVPPLTKEKNKYTILQIGLTLSEKTLKERIHTRLLTRMKKGMLREAKKLQEKGVTWKRMFALGLEYRYLALFLQNKISKQEMLIKLETEIWHYAKRQMTWFKRDKEIKWFSPTETPKIKKVVKEFLK